MTSRPLLRRHLRRLRLHLAKSHLQLLPLLHRLTFYLETGLHLMELKSQRMTSRLRRKHLKRLQVLVGALLTTSWGN